MRIMPLEYYYRMMSDEHFRQSLAWKGASIEVAHDALVELTGVDFGYDTEAWYKWLRQHDMIRHVPKP